MTRGYQMVDLPVQGDSNHTDVVSLVLQVVVHLVELGEREGLVDDADLFVVRQLEELAEDSLRIFFFERHDQVAFAQGGGLDLLVELVSFEDEEVARKEDFLLDRAEHLQAVRVELEDSPVSEHRVDVVVLQLLVELVVDRSLAPYLPFAHRLKLNMGTNSIN